MNNNTINISRAEYEELQKYRLNCNFISSVSEDVTYVSKDFLLDMEKAEGGEINWDEFFK